MTLKFNSAMTSVSKRLFRRLQLVSLDGCRLSSILRPLSGLFEQTLRLAERGVLGLPGPRRVAERR